MDGLNTLGGYQSLIELRRGLITTSYKSVQESTGHPVLLKVLRKRYEQDDNSKKLFKQKIAEAGKVTHSNLAAIVDAGHVDGKTYVASEYIEGISVEGLIKKGQVPAGLAAYVLFEIAQILKTVHEKNLLHQGIKPSNIRIAKDGKIKLTDLGLASLPAAMDKLDLEDTEVIPYLTPEQIVGGELSPASDIFALGVTVYEMLLGSHAFKGAIPADIQEQVLHHDAASYLHDDDSIPPQLRRICQQMLKKKAEQRYQDCYVLLADLNSFKKSRGVGAVATASDMRQYLADPEAYVRELRNNPVTVRKREPRMRPAPDAQAATKKATTKSSGDGVNVTRIAMVVGVLVLLFGGVSFASSFFFSKSGSWGANNNSNSSSPSTSEGRVSARRSSGAGGAAMQVKKEGASKSPSVQVLPPVAPPPQEVVVIEGETGQDDQKKQRDTTNTSNITPEPALADAALPDTVVLINEDQEKAAGKLNVTSTPRGGVFLNGDSLGTTPLSLNLMSGTYTISIKNPDYPLFTTIVDVVPGRETPLTIELDRYFGQIEIDAPASTKVWLGDTEYGTIPLSKQIRLKPGRHEVRIEHPTKGIIANVVDIRAGEVKKLQYD